MVLLSPPTFGLGRAEIESAIGSLVTGFGGQRPEG
jgi:hypothetical protein